MALAPALSRGQRHSHCCWSARRQRRLRQPGPARGTGKSPRTARSSPGLGRRTAGRDRVTTPGWTSACCTWPCRSYWHDRTIGRALFVVPVGGAGSAVAANPHCWLLVAGVLLSALALPLGLARGPRHRCSRWTNCTRPPPAGGPASGRHVRPVPDAAGIGRTGRGVQSHGRSTPVTDRRADSEQQRTESRAWPAWPKACWPSTARNA